MQSVLLVRWAYQKPNASAAALFLKSIWYKFPVPEGGGGVGAEAEYWSATIWNTRLLRAVDTARPHKMKLNDQPIESTERLELASRTPFQTGIIIVLTPAVSNETVYTSSPALEDGNVE